MLSAVAEAKAQAPAQANIHERLGMEAGDSGIAEHMSSKISAIRARLSVAHPFTAQSSRSAD